MAFPGTHNISYYQGDTLEFTIRPKASDGSPFSLDGYSAKFYIADKRGSGGTPVICLATISSGTVTCTIQPAVGEDLVAGTTYYYDVEIATSDRASVHTLLTGTVSVTADVVRV
jgi:hypothetical protein